MKFVPSSEVLMGQIVQMQSLAGFKLFHTKLTKHEKK